MYCKKCEKEYKNKEIYCEDCGEKLNHKKYKVTISKKTILIITTFFVSVLLLLGAYGGISYLNGPNHIAKKYIKAISKNDMDQLFSYLEKEEDLFVTKEILKEKNEKIKIDDYRIVSSEIKSNQATILFEYKNGSVLNYAYVLLEKEKNKFLIFPSWKVNSSKIVENVGIQVLKNSEVTIDGHDISKYKTDSANEYYDYYQIPNMIKGNYQIKATLPNKITIDKKITVDSNRSYLLSPDNLVATLKNNLEDKAIKNLNILYTSAINHKTYKEIENNFPISLEDLYDEIKNLTNQSNIASINFNDPSIKKNYFNESGNLVVLFTVDYTMTTKESIKNNKIYGSSTLAVEWEYKDNNFIIKNMYDWRG